MATLNAKSKHKTRSERRKQARRRRGVLWGLAGGMGLLVAWLVISNPLPGPGGASTVSGPAPDITVTTPDGDYRLSDQKGDLVALYFSFTG